MAASSKDKRTPITTPPYQVPSADVTPDPPTFSLDTTIKDAAPPPRTVIAYWKPSFQQRTEISLRRAVGVVKT